MDDEDWNSSTITREILHKLADAARRRKVDRNDPRIKGILVEVDLLAKQRMRLSSSCHAAFPAVRHAVDPSVVVDTGVNTSTLTREIQRKLGEVAQLRKADPNNPRIKAIIAEVDDLSKLRMKRGGFAGG